MANNENAGPEGLSEEQAALLAEEGVDVDAVVEEASRVPEEAPETAPETDTAAPEAAKPEGDEPEAAKEGTPADKAPAGFVPNQALKAAREEAKGYRDRLREMESVQQQIALKLAEQREAKQEQQPGIPDPDEDPMAYLKWQREQYITDQRQQQEHQQQAQQQHAQQQQAQQVFNAVDHEFREATQVDPEVQAAYDHAWNSYSQELTALGVPGQSQQDRLMQFVQGFANNYMASAKPNGMSMPEYVKAIASARGWRPPEQKANGAEQTIERQQKAMEASKTLSKSGAGAGETTLQDVLSMSGEEIEQFATENPELFAKLHG